MKKIMLVLAAMTASYLFAEDVHLKSGDLSVLKNAKEYAYVEIDWSKAQVVEFGRGNKVDKNLGSIDAYNKKQGADWVKDWPELKRFVAHCTAWQKYPARPCFNKKNKKGVQITVNPEYWKAYQNCKNEEEREDMKDHCVWVNPSEAKYKFVLTVDQVDMGSGTASGFGMNVRAGGAILKGTVKLVEIKTGKQLAQVAVDYCKGYGNYSQRTRLMDVIVAEVFGELAELIP